MKCPICKKDHKLIFYRGKSAMICPKKDNIVYVVLVVPKDDHDLQAAAYEAMLKG